LFFQTALSFIIERKEGLLDRSWMAGVTATEVMLAHVVAQFVVLLVQVRIEKQQSHLKYFNAIKITRGNLFKYTFCQQK
jgi:hypothetical protein